MVSFNAVILAAIAFHNSLYVLSSKHLINTTSLLLDGKLKIVDSITSQGDFIEPIFRVLLDFVDHFLNFKFAVLTELKRAFPLAIFGIFFKFRDHVDVLFIT